MVYKEKLIIIGAGGHGKVVADIAIRMKKWEHIFFLDDNEAIKSALNINVIGKSDDAMDFINEADIFVAIGDNRTREIVQERLAAQGASIPVIIHPGALIGQDVEFNIGTTVMAGVVISPCVSIGKGCIINSGAIVEHDNIIMDYVHVSPGVSLAGNVKVGKGCWLGIGSTVSNNINITQGCTIGAGAVVVRDIPASGIYIGVPAKKAINVKTAEMVK